MKEKKTSKNKVTWRTQEDLEGEENFQEISNILKREEGMVQPTTQECHFLKSNIQRTKELYEIKS